MSLLELIQSGSTTKEIENYLRELARQSSDQLSTELSQRDPQGMTSLYLAVKKGDFDLVKLLLSYDASTEIKINNQTIEDYASKLVESKPDKESKYFDPQNQQRKHIYALIKSRGRWQAQAAKNQEVLFSRSMKAIEDAMENIRGAENKTGVLFVGITGQGKSTLINFLSGVDYEIKMGDDGAEYASPQSNSMEIARVGKSTTSETLLPQVIPPKSGSYVLVDLPGFEDTRGTAEEICAAASICMLTKQLQKIQGILFICSWESLKDSRMVSFRAAAQNVGAMISRNPQTERNVVLVVTKPAARIEEKHIRTRLEQLCENEKWNDSKLDYKEPEKGEMTADQWKKQCIRKTTRAVLAGKNNIFLADVTKPEVRKKFDALINHLGAAVQKPNEFEFSNYSRFMTQFILVVENMIVNYNQLAGNKHIQEEKLNKLRTSISGIMEEKNQLAASIEQFENQKNQPFTAESLDKTIEDEKNKLKALRKKLLKYKSELKNAENELLIKNAQTSVIESDGEKLIDTVHRGWVCEKTEERTETEVEECGRPVYIPGLGFGQPVKINKKTIPGIEKTVSEQIRYPSPVPIQRYVDVSQGGTFTASGFAPGAMELSGTFKSSPGARGGVSLSIQLYGNAKDFPGTKEKINRLEQELKTAKNQLEAAQRDPVSQEDVDDVMDNLRKIELEKIAAVGNQEKTKAICEMQINLLMPQVQASKKKLEELNQQLPKEEAELEDLSLQIQVNSELFDKLYQIIKVMGFTSEVFDQFMRLYSNNSSPAISQSSSSLSLSVSPSRKTPQITYLFDEKTRKPYTTRSGQKSLLSSSSSSSSSNSFSSSSSSSTPLSQSTQTLSGQSKVSQKQQMMKNMRLINQARALVWEKLSAEDSETESSRNKYLKQITKMENETSAFKNLTQNEANISSLIHQLESLTAALEF